MTDHRWTDPNDRRGPRAPAGGRDDRTFVDPDHDDRDDQAYEQSDRSGHPRPGGDHGRHGQQAYGQDPRGDWEREDEAGFFVDDGEDEGPWQAVEDRDGARLRRNLLFGGAAVLLVLVGGSFWVFSGSAPEGGLPEQAPLIAAAPGPFKERPVDAGGLEVPHQNRQILQTLGGRHAPDRVERLLPGPEEPLPIPAIRSADEDPATVAGIGGVDPDGGEGAAAADGQLPLIPEAQRVEERDVQPVPSAAPIDEEMAGDDFEETTVGFEGREDQIAALIEQMGILDAGADDPSLAAGAEAEPGPAGAASPETVPEDGDGGAPGQQGQPEDPEIVNPVADGGFRIQLGSVDSAEAARSEWARLSARHDDLLGRLSMSVEAADISGRAWYRVQAGPLSREAAERTCRQLEDRNAGCMVVGR